MGESVRGVMAKARLSPDDILALAVDTTCCSVLALDEKGEPLRPCMIWMDVRSSTEAADVLATGDPALRINGAGTGPISAEWMIPKALWLNRHQPEIYARARMIGEYQDYINLKLTGEWVGSLGNSCIRWHYQTQHGGVPHSLLKALDMSELAGKWPQKMLAPGAPIGGLLKSAAEHLGLKPGTLVVQAHPVGHEIALDPGEHSFAPLSRVA